MTKAADLQSSEARGRPANPAFVYLAAAFAALGGLLFGYDTGVISGAELFFRNEFALSTFALEVIVSGVLAGRALRPGRSDWRAARGFVWPAKAVDCDSNYFCRRRDSLRSGAFRGGPRGRTHHRRFWNRIIVQRSPCLYFRSGSGRGARLAGFAVSTGHHGWNPRRVSCGLRIRAHSGMAMDVRPGSCPGGNLWRGDVFPAGKSALALPSRKAGHGTSDAGAHTRNKRRRRGAA